MATDSLPRRKMLKVAGMAAGATAGIAILSTDQLAAIETADEPLTRPPTRGM